MHDRALRLYRRPLRLAPRRYFDWLKAACYLALLLLFVVVWAGVGFVVWLVFQ